MISIITPSYNRAHTLPRLYESLLKQDATDFEWVVVDDGSIDDTANLVEGFKQSAHFSILYIKQGNQGKHVALNAGVAASSGEWLFIVDSDDALSENAVGIIVKEAASLGTKHVGMCFRKAYFSNQLIGKCFTPGARRTISPTQAGNLVGGDLAYVFRRDAMVAEPFPIFPEEKFVPELYIWNKIGDLGEIVFFLDICIYLCDYLPDGLTVNFKKNLKRNPRGFGLFYRAQFFRECHLIGKAKCFVRSLQCSYYAFIKGKA